MRFVVALVAVVGLAACAPSVAPVAPLPVACSPIDLMEVEAPPAAPVLSASERLAVYQAILAALPLETAKAWFRFYEVEQPGHARRQTERISVMRERCLTSDP